MAGLALLAAQIQRRSRPNRHPSQSEINLAIVGDIGAPLHYAVPDFVALTPDPETVAAAKLMAEVLFNDLAFEREFDLIPRDTYRTIPPAPVGHRHCLRPVARARRGRRGGGHRPTDGQHVSRGDASVQHPDSTDRARQAVRRHQNEQPALGRSLHCG